MARYYFQANYRGVTVVDEIGEDFPTLQQAKAHATVVAQELSRNDPWARHYICAQPGGDAAREYRDGE